MSKEPPEPPPRAGRWALPRWAWALVFGALAASLAYVLVAAWERDRRRDELARLVSARAHSLTEYVRLASALLATVQGFSDGCGKLEPGSTTAYLETLDDASGGWATLAWVPLVPGSDSAAFEALAQRYGHPPTGIRRRVEARWIAAEAAAEYAPVVWVSHPGTSDSLVGWDLLGEPAFARVLEAARRGGEGLLTGPVVLPLEGGLETSARGAVALVRPIYRADQPRVSEEARARALLGWVVALLAPRELLAEAIDAYSPAGLDTHLLDATGGLEVPLAGLGSRLGPLHGLRPWSEVRATDLTYGVLLPTLGRDWRLVGVGRSGFLTGNWPWHAWAALASVVLLSGAAAVSMRAASRRVEAARRAVAQATEALERSNENLRIQVAARRATESLGSGLTHEVNNVLMGVLGNAELALLDLPPNDSLRARLEEVRRGATEAARMLRGGAAPEASADLVPADPSLEITASGGIRRDGKRRGRLLVADDDPDVLPLLVQLLRTAGHDVVPARDAGEALAAVEAPAHDVEVVLLDASLAGGGGEALARTLAEVAPRARLLLVSGDPEDDVRGRFPGIAVAGFVGKPFERTTLLDAVDRALAP